MVNLSEDADPLGSELVDLDEYVAEPRLEELVLVATESAPSPWNWKVGLENFMESYHHHGVHPETLESRFHGAQSFVIHGDAAPWSLLDHVSIDPNEAPFVVVNVYPTLAIAGLRGERRGLCDQHAHR